MTKPRYSVDTSAFIKGRRDLYVPGVFVGLWDQVAQLIQVGDLVAVDVVRDELDKRDDEVRAWARSQLGLFVPLHADVQAGTSRVLTAVPKLVGNAKGRNTADPFVIGLALARGLTVVTEETRSGSLARPRIPDACEAVGVPCTTLVGLATAEGWTFR